MGAPGYQRASGRIRGGGCWKRRGNSEHRPVSEVSRLESEVLMWTLSYNARKRFQLRLGIQKQPVKPTRPHRAWWWWC